MVVVPVIFLLLFSFWAHFLVLGPAEGRGEDDWVAYQRPGPGAIYGATRTVKGQTTVNGPTVDAKPPTSS